MRRTVAGLFVALGLVVAGCGDGDASSDAAGITPSTTVAAGTSTSVPATSIAVQVEAAEPAEPAESAVGSDPSEPAAGVAPPAAAAPAPAVTSPVAAPVDDGPVAAPVPDPNPFNCVGEICPNPYTDAPAPDPNADPRNPQIVWCGTDKYVHDRGATVWNDGTWSPWSQHCADVFDAVNNPPNPPGQMGGGGAVSGPCRPGEEGTVTFTPDMRKQRCSGGQWVFIR